MANNEQSLFKRVLNSYTFKNSEDYKNILYHYETMKFDQAKNFLTESEIFNLNIVVNKIYSISSEFIDKYKIYGLHLAFNKLKNYIELMPHTNELSSLDAEIKKDKDHEFEYNYIILEKDTEKRFIQIRDAIIESLIDYEFELDFQNLEVQKNILLKNFII